MCIAPVLPRLPRPNRPAVKPVVRTPLNARGVASVDVLLIATNSQFSNPTRDWVKQWQETNPLPVICLWDRYDLERHVSKHPAVAVRLFADALSNQGRLEVLRSQFWNAYYFPEETDLKRVWRYRRELEWHPESLLAVLAGEIMNGDIGKRPWAMDIDDSMLCRLILCGLLNIPYFYLHATRIRSSNKPYWSALVHLILVALDRFTVGSVMNLFDITWKCYKNTPSEEVKQIILSRIVLRLRAELGDVCLSDCSRVSRIPSDPEVLDKNRIEVYWDQLRLPTNETVKPVNEKPTNDAIFFIELFDTPCKVGFELNKEHRCPFMLEQEEETIDWGQMLTVFQQVISVRKRQRKPR